MSSTPDPAQEALRQQALEHYGIPQTLAGWNFQGLASLAAELCGAPLAYVSFVGSTQTHYLAGGMPPVFTLERTHSFCNLAVEGKDVFEVPTVSAHPQLHLPESAGPAIRSYAAAPLLTPEGCAIGTLCVVSPLARVLSVQQRRGLALLAQQVVQQLELDRTRRQVDQMKTEFLSTVSHELRTPLSAISGALGLISGGALGDFPQQAQPMLDIALKNCQRLSELVNDLLDMERLAAGKLVFDLRAQPLMPIVEEALQAGQAFAYQYKVNLALAERADGVQLRVDGERLQQVLLHFISNAAKFSPAGGRVDISARRLTPGSVRVQVRDQGPGIPLNFRARVFQKFTQSDSSDSRRTGGTGLGLAISKEMAERMGGAIGFESTPGAGACFFVDFPLALAATPQSAAGLPAAGTGNAHKPRILHVEDDRDIHSIVLAIGREIADFDLAPTLAEARALLARQRYALVLLDIGMPDGSGWELLPQLNQLSPKPPVIVLSNGELSVEQRASVHLALLKSRIPNQNLLDIIRQVISPEPDLGKAVP
jgi:signal transduction histidine kinase/CheY-like chemotaxis protein